VSIGGGSSAALRCGAGSWNLADAGLETELPQERPEARLVAQRLELRHDVQLRGERALPPGALQRAQRGIVLAQRHVHGGLELDRHVAVLRLPVEPGQDAARWSVSGGASAARYG
jgi:hypothetical protein